MWTFLKINTTKEKKYRKTEPYKSHMEGIVSMSQGLKGEREASVDLVTRKTS